MNSAPEFHNPLACVGGRPAYRCGNRCNHPRNAFDVERNDSSAARNLNFECDKPDTDIARWLRLLQQYVDMMGTKYSSTVD